MPELIYTIDEVNQIAKKLLHVCRHCAIFTLTGSLGAGKTTLTRALLTHLGVTEMVTSPTFTYVNVYTGTDDLTIYHFDCYRIATLNEFTAQGFDEYLYAPNSICLIEWPEIIMPLLQHNVCHINLEYRDETSRQLHYTIQV